MDEPTFRAMVVRETGAETFERAVEQRPFDSLPPHPVLVRVHYSSLNYKDALSASGNKGVTKSYPHTPGIDAAGIVEQSDSPEFSAGDPVIVTSYGLGENTSGGFGQFIRVPAEWIVPLPKNLSLRESMILGTAGFTAAYGIHKLRQNGMRPEDGPILVTGATGGVGSLAVTLLSHAGYTVTAATGKLEKKDFLTELGAEEIINRSELTDASDKPLMESRWAGAIDTVGGGMLDAALRQTRHNGTVACCGNILGGQLQTSIYPFILRGISLMGIDSGRCPMPTRRNIWSLLADEWKPTGMNDIARDISLEQLEDEIKKILHGGQAGRIVVNLNVDE